MSIFELVMRVCLSACAVMLPAGFLVATVYLVRRGDIGLRLMSAAYLFATLMVTAFAAWALEALWS